MKHVVFAMMMMVMSATAGTKVSAGVRARHAAIIKNVVKQTEHDVSKIDVADHKAIVKAYNKGIGALAHQIMVLLRSDRKNETWPYKQAHDKLAEARNVVQMKIFIEDYNRKHKRK